jgi:sirohydrochlorin cobaltochelatase
VTLADTDYAELALLERRLNMLLPEEYQDADSSVEPAPMGSAGLRFDADGRVAWDQIWGAFCDLAMGGGPPHKGRLLQPGSRADIVAAPERYAEVVQEICRGVQLAADLQASAAPDPGWVRVRCFTDAMAGWLLRAITMENVAVRGGARTIDLPAGPGYRLDKELKNVVTVIAKTSHYWAGHIPRTQKNQIAWLFETIAAETPLIGPADEAAGPGRAGQDTREALAAAIQRGTGLPSADERYSGWLGLELPSVGAAIWMMRALVVCNVLARREDTILYVPVNPSQDPHGDETARRITSVWRLARAKGLLA